MTSSPGTARNRRSPSIKQCSFAIGWSWNPAVSRPQQSTFALRRFGAFLRGCRYRFAQPRVGRGYSTGERRETDRSSTWELAKRRRGSDIFAFTEREHRKGQARQGNPYDTCRMWAAAVRGRAVGKRRNEISFLSSCFLTTTFPRPRDHHIVRPRLFRRGKAR